MHQQQTLDALTQSTELLRAATVSYTHLPMPTILLV